MAKDINKLIEKYESEKDSNPKENKKQSRGKSKKSLKVNTNENPLKKPKLDNKDRLILYYLDENARIPLTQLAKKVHLSKQNLLYRLKKLEKDKVILKYTTIIDIHKLGLLSYRIYIRYGKINYSSEKKILDYFSKTPEVVWCASLSGSWDLEVVFGLNNFIQLSNILKEFRQEFAKNIFKINVSMSVVNYHFPRDYLIGHERNKVEPRSYGFEPKEEKIDKIDTRILKELSKDCRQNFSEIGDKTGVTYHTVKQRIKQLEKKGIIQGYRILIDFSKVGKEYYKSLISLGTLSKEDEQKVYSFLSSYNFVSYFIEILGEWGLEIESEVENSDQIDKLIRELRNKFPDLISDYTTIKVLKENKLNYLPIK